MAFVNFNVNFRALYLMMNFGYVKLVINLLLLLLLLLLLFVFYCWSMMIWTLC